MRLRLLGAVVGIVALVLLVHDVPLAGHLERVERDRLVTKLERDAFILAGRSEEDLEQETAANDPTLARLVADYSAAEDVRVVVVDDAAIGVLGSDLERTVGADFGNRPEIQRALDGVSNSGQRASETLGEDLFFVAVPVLSGDDVVGAVRFSAPERTVSERTADRVRGLFVVAAISLLIAVAVAGLLSLMITRPLSRLRTATLGLASGNLSTRADIDDGPPEVRDLAASFNTMAVQLQQMVERQQAFAGTASHQLRTPLTALRLQLEQLGNDVADQPSASRRVDDAIAESDRLHRMIEGLLTLSRAEVSEVGAAAIAPAEIIEQRVDQWRALAEERNVGLIVEIESLRSVRALPGSVEQVVDNLIDNALEVSPSGSTIVVALRDAPAARPSDRPPAGVELHVIDQGPGLTDADRQHAFQRFWRGSGAGPQGSGLGLAIVEQLVSAAGGSTRLDRSAGGGIDAVVVWVAAERSVAR